MRKITIENKYNVLRVYEGKMPSSRLMWGVTDQLEVYVKGPLNDREYPIAANLAMNVCCEMRIPVIQMTRKSTSQKKHSMETSTRRMF